MRHAQYEVVTCWQMVKTLHIVYRLHWNFGRDVLWPIYQSYGGCDNALNLVDVSPSKPGANTICVPCV